MELGVRHDEIQKNLNNGGNDAFGTQESVRTSCKL